MSNHQNTPLTFQGPGFPTPSWHWQIVEESSDGEMEEATDPPRAKDFVFRKELPPLVYLVGEYDLIFFMHLGGSQHALDTQHRVISGKMELSSSSDNNNSNGLLRAVLTIPDEVKDELVVINSVFRGIPEIHVHFDGEGVGRVPQSSGTGVDFDQTELVVCSMQCVSERLAVGYMPECNRHRSQPTQRLRDFAESISFQSADEAEQLVKDYHRAALLESNQHVLSEVSTMLSEYLSTPTELPPPAFVFEEGDLVLSMDFNDDYDEVCPKFVARRRTKKRRRS